jgi:hypothetical protein
VSKTVAAMKKELIPLRKHTAPPEQAKREASTGGEVAAVGLCSIAIADERQGTQHATLINLPNLDNIT